jgi:hypothetical protein
MFKEHRRGFSRTLTYSGRRPIGLGWRRRQSSKGARLESGRERKAPEGADGSRTIRAQVERDSDEDHAAMKETMAMLGQLGYENPKRHYTYPRKRDSDRHAI